MCHFQLAFIKWEDKVPTMLLFFKSYNKVFFSLEIHNSLALILPYLITEVN